MHCSSSMQSLSGWDAWSIITDCPETLQKDEKTFNRLIKDALFQLDECKKYSGISTFVDVNPESIL